MSSATWKVRSLYWSVSLTTAARELARYKLDFMGVQEVRWDQGGAVRSGDFFFFVEKEKKIFNWGEDLCAPQNSVSLFVSDRMSYIHVIRRGSWCNIIFLNVHAPTEENIDDPKDSFYEGLEKVFDHVP
jgi:hypothetical protein